MADFLETKWLQMRSDNLPLSSFLGNKVSTNLGAIHLVRIIEGEGNAKGDEALEIAESWLPRFKRYVSERIAEEVSQSQVPCCEVSPTNEDYVQGPCFISPNAPEEEVQQKRLRANKAYYIRAFSDLSNDDFEVLCARVLSLWRVEKDFVSRRSADQGVDFFGRVPFGEIMKPSAIGNGAERQLKLWLVGQAKNYSASQVSTKDIRELVGSVNLARSKTYAGSIDPLSQLEMRTCDPVFFLFLQPESYQRMRGTYCRNPASWRWMAHSSQCFLRIMA